MSDAGEWEPDPVSRRLNGVLHDLLLTRHAALVQSVREGVVAGRLSVSEAFDELRPLVNLEGDAVRLLRAMLRG